MSEHPQPTELQHEIFHHGNEGDIAIWRAQTLVRLLYEQTSEIRADEPYTAATQGRVEVVRETLEREIDEIERIFDNLWKAARRATHPDTPAAPDAGKEGQP